MNCWFACRVRLRYLQSLCMGKRTILAARFAASCEMIASRDAMGEFSYALSRGPFARSS